MQPHLILASQSPRRRELLNQLGLRVQVCPADIDEGPKPGETAAEYALRIALEKARAGAVAAKAVLPVLGADTDVVVDGEILGKPASREQGIAMLRRLAERRHEVYSAVAVGLGDRWLSRLSVTEVHFGPISQAQAEAYWNSGEPADKAGGYGIQGLGGGFVREIRGSYSGVVGLPLYETCELLREFGIEFLLPGVAAP